MLPVQKVSAASRLQFPECELKGFSCFDSFAVVSVCEPQRGDAPTEHLIVEVRLMTDSDWCFTVLLHGAVICDV